MAVLHNPRHEQFAQLVASGKPSPEAYVAAGYAEKAAYTCGPRLLKTPSVRARVDELRSLSAQSLATAVAITANWITAEFIENLHLARAKDQLGAANTALEKLAKIHGILVERSEQNINVRKVDYSVFTDEQIESLISLLKHHDAAVAAKKAAGLPAPGQVVDVEPVVVVTSEASASAEAVDGAGVEEASPSGGIDW